MRKTKIAVLAALIAGITTAASAQVYYRSDYPAYPGYGYSAEFGYPAYGYGYRTYGYRAYGYPAYGYPAYGSYYGNSWSGGQTRTGPGPYKGAGENGGG